jgi:hypothetical protein
VAAVCTIVAAGLLMIGPLLTWAEVSADPVAFAGALDEDVKVVMPAIEDSSSDFTWLEADRGGGAAVFAGLALLVLGVVVAVRATRVGGIVTATVGAGCVWLAVTNLPQARDIIAEAVDGVVGWAYAAHVDPARLTPAFTVARGPSISAVVAGGALAIVGGILTVVAVEREEATGLWVPWTHLTDDDTAGSVG